MNIKINFEIGDVVWFIHPKTLKAYFAKLKAVKTHTTLKETNVKYNVDVPLVGGSEEVYVWNVFATKESLLENL